MRLTTPRSSENGPRANTIVLSNAHRARRRAARLSGLSRQRFSALAHWRHSGCLSEGPLSTYRRNSYVDGPLPARPEQHLIGSLAIICSAFVGAIARDRWPRWVPRREFQTNWRPQGSLNFAECFASRIDRSHHLLFSCKFTHRRSTAALILCSPWQADLMPHGPELAMQRCPDRLGRWPSSSRQCGQSCWLALRQQASAVYA